MKKLPFISFVSIFIFVTSASATVYKWVDRDGTLNFADDYSRIPRDYRNQVEELNAARMGSSTPSPAPSGKTITGAPSLEAAKQPPPIAQTLVREGEFAIQMVEALKIGRAKNEAEAESMLASAGITPKNGWIADYPMTPDIIGELEKAVGEAADAQKLALGKNEALKALRTVAVEQELPIIVEGSDEYGESPPPTTPEYTTLSEIDNYYYAEGPPVVTYYPPPWDYYYLYAWVPGPFWCSGLYFPGFFILHDFHRGVHRNGHAYVVTNHWRDPGTGRIFAVDPARRDASRTFGGREALPLSRFNTAEARNGARSIFERSQGRLGSGNTSMAMPGRGPAHANPSYSKLGRGEGGKQAYNKESRPPGFSDRMGHDRKAMNIQRPFAGEPRSFNPHSRGSQGSSGPSPQARAGHSGSSSMGSKGVGGSQQGRGGGSGSGHGGSRF